MSVSPTAKSAGPPLMSASSSLSSCATLSPPQELKVRLHQLIQNS